jgi:hypothetical protein
MKLTPEQKKAFGDANIRRYREALGIPQDRPFSFEEGIEQITWLFTTAGKQAFKDSAVECGLVKP